MDRRAIEALGSVLAGGARGVDLANLLFREYISTTSARITERVSGNSIPSLAADFESWLQS
jgi:hypothetical protein